MNVEHCQGLTLPSLQRTCLPWCVKSMSASYSNRVTEQQPVDVSSSWSEERFTAVPKQQKTFLLVTATALTTIFEQKLSRDSFESCFQKMRILQNKWELWLHSKFMDMPSVIKKIKESEPGNHYLPLLHLYLRVVCLRHEGLWENKSSAKPSIIHFSEQLSYVNNLLLQTLHNLCTLLQNLLDF